MTAIQIFVLAVVQGLTEFLPVSSSAHLILVPRLSDWPDQGLAFDVAVHVGTLTAVIWYFRREVITLLLDWSQSCLKQQAVGESRLAWLVVIGSIPLGLAGLLLHDFVETVLRSPVVIAWATIGFGLLLWLADVMGKRLHSEQQLGWRDGILIGISQILALVPGTSRSGITMTTGLMLGMTREAAARFSFLLSIPAILMAGSYKTYKLITVGNHVDWTALLSGIALSAVSAYLCIHLFMKMLERIGMWPFVLYRLALGVMLLIVFQS